jgi:hypothetical protein
LESAVQLRVQERIDELSTNPEPRDAEKDTDGLCELRDFRCERHARLSGPAATLEVDGDHRNAGNGSSNAIARELHGVFREEPLWVDLSWVQSQDQLSLAYPPFQDAVGTIAAAIRRVDKNTILSTEVSKRRQLRRVLTLTVSLSMLFALFSTVSAYTVWKERAATRELQMQVQSSERALSEAHREVLMLQERSDTLQRVLTTLQEKQNVNTSQGKRPRLKK